MLTRRLVFDDIDWLSLEEGGAEFVFRIQHPERLFTEFDPGMTYQLVVYDDETMCVVETHNAPHDEDTYSVLPYSFNDLEQCAWITKIRQILS